MFLSHKIAAAIGSYESLADKRYRQGQLVGMVAGVLLLAAGVVGLVLLVGVLV